MRIISVPIDSLVKASSGLSQAEESSSGAAMSDDDVGGASGSFAKEVD